MWVCGCVGGCDVAVGGFGVFCFVFLFLLSSYQQLGFEAKVRMANVRMANVRMAGMTKPIA